MVFDLKKLIKKYSMNIKNVVHIGGHYGQEIKLYKEINPSCKIQIFEPHPETFKTLLDNVFFFDDVVCHNLALGPTEMTMNMFVENNNNGQSNSLLKPKLHLQQYPHITFDSNINVIVKPLDFFNLDDSYNFVSIDVQGYELEVLKGCEKTLENIDYIISEVNNQELYENCCKVQDVDEFLARFNFKRVETDWEGHTWGDALYIKQ